MSLDKCTLIIEIYHYYDGGLTRFPPENDLFKREHFGSI